MARNKSLDDIIVDAERIVRVWEANPTFALNEITLSKLKKMVDDVRAGRANADELRRQLTQTTNEVDAQASEVMGVTTRALSGIRAFYGPDSSQYEEAGGTRTSERKKAVRKASKKGTP